jgi:predicted Zn-dependent protease
MNRQYAILGTAAAAGAAGAAVGYNQDEGEGALTYGAVAAGAALALGQYFGMGFTRDDENEADKLGFAFYTRAGWDPTRFAGFFQTLVDKGYDKTPENLSDHPKLSNRVAATQRRIGQLPPDASQWRRPPVADEKRFAEMKGRAAQIAKNTPKDKSLEQARLMLASFPSCVTTDEQPDQEQARAIIYQAKQEEKKSR